MSPPTPDVPDGADDPEGLEPASLRKAPPLPMDFEPPPFAYDPKIGEEAFSVQADAIRALDPSKVVLPNMDASLASLVALGFAENGRRGERKAEFESVAHKLGEHTLDELEQRAWALFYLDLRARSYEAVRSESKVDRALAKQGYEARTRVVDLLTYHFRKNPFMMMELADIRRGNGLLDLAVDLARLAGHISVHKAALDHDRINYRADDETMLRGLSNQIREELTTRRDNETPDLRNRAWTRMVETYGVLKLAADFLFRDRPKDLAYFPPLRRAVFAYRSRKRAPKPPAPPPSADSDAAPVHTSQDVPVDRG